jgi:nitroreductase
MEIETTNTAVSTSETVRAIYQRRAVRKYKDQPVERELIEEVIDAGRMAPSAVNRQPWEFYVLTDKKSILAFSKEIAGAIKGADHPFHFAHGPHSLASEDPIFHGAPVVIFITAPRDNEWASLDVGMCAQNMMLAAKAMGIDSCPVGLGKFVEQTEIFKRLEVPASEQVVLSIILGYGDELPEMPERKSNNIRFID